MDYTTGVRPMVRDPRSPVRPAARNIWRDLRGVRRAHSSRRSGVRARDGWEGHEVRRRFLDAEPIDLARRHGAVAERRGPRPPRRARRTGARRRHFPGRHRTPHAGGAVSAGAEDGSHRTAGRRRGARLQQSADRDSGVLRAVAGRSRSGRSAPGGHCGNSEGGHARRGAHAPVAGLQPQADHRADAARPERGRDRHAGDARTPHRGRREGRAGPPARAGAREGRSRAGGADRHEPRGERAGRHAETAAR